MTSAKKYSFTLLATLFVFTMGFIAERTLDGDYYREVKRGLRLMGDVYKNISEKYVDEIPPREFMRTGIDEMLQTLDPYTAFYEEAESGDLNALMNGKYGGIGVNVGIRAGYITVISTLTGSPAQKSGILPGDRIFSVDGETSKTLKIQDMSARVKGDPGSKVRLSILREGSDVPLSFELIREMIPLENISYFGVSKDNVGYIKLNKFSRTAGSDFNRALKEMKQQNMQSLILDLRGNPGGLLDAAIEITNQFVKKGEMITYTRGRIEDANRDYKATNDPLYPGLPLAVLVDGGSASASEIESGSLQDLDRAVVIGSNTFGKGLVQTVYPLVERDAVIKITTAKYFTPSGRCIQKEFYSHKRAPRESKKADDEEDTHENWIDTFGFDESEESRAASDTSQPPIPKSFMTKNGRIVYSNGGVKPDVELSQDASTPYMREILKGGFIFDFATRYRAKNARIDSNFTADEKLMSEFKSYLGQRKFVFHSESEKSLNLLKSRSIEHQYSSEFVSRIENLKSDLIREEARDFELSKQSIKKYVEIEIVSRYWNESARVEYTLMEDRYYQEALGLLKDKAKFHKILAAPK